MKTLFKINMKKKQVFALAIMISLFLCAISAQAQNISLTITGIKNNKGQMVVSVFKDNESFKDEKPATKFKFPKATVTNGTMKVDIALSPGTYGIALLDDEDGNGEMKKNMFKIPKEGFGFSNFYLSGMSRPVFDDFKFDVKNTPVKLESKLRYM
jgi:uncharacterized protein (DUF2141 family)